MMNRWPILLAAMLALGACGRNAVQDTASKPAAVGGLACSFTISPPADKAAEVISANMILTNQSHEAIRVCTWCMPWRSGSRGKCHVLMTPDGWKSDQPTEGQLAQHIETIAPGASVSIPFMMERGASGTIEITGEYAVGEAFAKRLKIWGGLVEARMFTGHLP